MRHTNESGIAMITTLLVLMLMSALLVGFTTIVMSDQRYRFIDRDRGQAFYAASAGVEKLTADLGNLFLEFVAPTNAQVTALTAPAKLPVISGITFAAATTPTGLPAGLLTTYHCNGVPAGTKSVPIVGTNGYTIRFCADAAGNPVRVDDPLVISGTGTYAGMVALQTPYQIDVTAKTSTGGEVHLVRTLQSVAIPVFQFGMFSDSDLSFFAREEAQVRVREHPELEHRNRHRLERAHQVHFAAGRRLRGHVNLIRRLQRDHPRVRTGSADDERVIHSDWITGRVCAKPDRVSVGPDNRDGFGPGRYTVAVIGRQQTRGKAGGRGGCGERDAGNDRKLRRRRQGRDLRVGRRDELKKEVAEVGGELLDARAGRVECLAAVTVDETVALIAHDDGRESHEQRGHEHEDEQRRDHRDAALVGVAHRMLFLGYRTLTGIFVDGGETADVHRRRDVIAHVVLHRLRHHLRTHADVDVHLPNLTRGVRDRVGRYADGVGQRRDICRVGYAVIQVVGQVDVFDDAGQRLRHEVVHDPREPRRAWRRRVVDVVGDHQRFEQRHRDGGGGPGIGGKRLAFHRPERTARGARRHRTWWRGRVRLVEAKEIVRVVCREVDVCRVNRGHGLNRVSSGAHVQHQIADLDLGRVVDGVSQQPQRVGGERDVCAVGRDRAFGCRWGPDRRRRHHRHELVDGHDRDDVGRRARRARIRRVVDGRPEVVTGRDAQQLKRRVAVVDQVEREIRRPRPRERDAGTGRHGNPLGPDDAPRHQEVSDQLIGPGAQGLVGLGALRRRIVD